MTLTFAPHSEHWRDAVIDLNERMKPKGGWGFFVDPTPTWLPRTANCNSFREYVLAIENDATVRGGYVLKHESALIAGQQRTLACVQGPYSEGATDSRHAKHVFAMVRDMLQREPLLYGWGHSVGNRTQHQYLFVLVFHSSFRVDSAQISKVCTWISLAKMSIRCGRKALHSTVLL